MAQIIRYNNQQYRQSDNVVYKTNLSIAKVVGVVAMGAVYIALMVPCKFIALLYTKAVNFLRRVREK